ncbi:GNAT family N-acetyltransferase [Cellulomonas fimi]|uniref:GNAT family N-acetyltransferase n=1 Tax=Cellulomonas fimi TaxID=1708 RepID=UPI0028932DB1|nr:GNAT family N-acetyltransferase [Cellulomonas fimi]
MRAEHRGQGLAKLLVATMVDDGPGAHFRWILFTQDAHGLYEAFGFAAPDETAMVRPAR